MKALLTARPGITFALALVLVVVSAPGAKPDSARDVQRMAEAAEAFLSSLDAGQRGEASFLFDSDERLRFHFIPVESFPRQGLRIRDMSETQRGRAHDLLGAGLSSRGYLTAQQIIELEGILRDLEGESRRLARDPEEYLLSVFGTPSPGGTWGWRFEGHHLSLNFTIVAGEAVASAPAFLGANPAEVREGPRRGLRPLAAEEDAARALLEALDASQREQAILDDVAPRDIVTGAELDIAPLSPDGISATDLSSAQRALLMDLVAVYTGVMADELAAQRMARLTDAGVDRISFAWAGSSVRGEPHYYRVQGPTFLIEYDNTQNDANHIHSVWRDFEGDFGRDLLREHLRDDHQGGDGHVGAAPHVHDGTPHLHEGAAGHDTGPG
jgi:Protein of unknown function (DUF3500)